MVYRTLHSYILRELLRIFFLTASALTTLLAFGGMFRPLTKQGIDVDQLMKIMLTLMPAMLAYAIPIAALFAAVLVYWRMSTDNELTACRAGGISFITIIVPAFFLGLVVASVDLVFVNYVVPKYLQRTERVVMSDLAGIIVATVGRQEKVQFNKWTVCADSAIEEESTEPGTAIVKLHGMAAEVPVSNNNFAIVAAREATLTIRYIKAVESVEIGIKLADASGFDPNNAFRRMSGSLDTIPPRVLPSMFRYKAKFLNWRKLRDLSVDPTSFPPVADPISQIDASYRMSVVNENFLSQWKKATQNGKLPYTFSQLTVGAAGKNMIRVTAPTAFIDPKANPAKALVLASKPGFPIKVETFAGNTLQATYTSEAAGFQLAADPFAEDNPDISASLSLTGNVTRRDHIRNIGPINAGSPIISGLALPPEVANVPPMDKLQLRHFAAASTQPDLMALSATVEKEVARLYKQIDSELHSRGSFSLSCLTLVLLGAALGILLRGKNPLAVFVMGFVPAVVLVLLITAGRQLAEGNAKNVPIGLALIWGGNVLLLALIAGVYAKLLRH